MLATHEKTSAAAQDDVNGRLYRRADLVRLYVATNLYPPEATAFVRYRGDIHQRRVLDLGCGAGRLATYLRPLTDQYCGVDVSPHMVDHCRRAFAGMRFLQGDMRSLPTLADGSFDAVVAVFNLFDAVSHEDRLRTLAEARRVLAPGGLLFFSAHNRNFSHAADGPKLEFRRNPVNQLRCMMDYLRARSNRRRIKPHQRFERDYALLNDSGHNFSVLHYYIGREAQAKQLADVGFRLVECLDEVGRTLPDGADDSAYASIHYVARSEA
jgi:SAM-dependent methyltransferase